MDALGYYSFVKSIADCGKFSISTMTAIRSAMVADLWEVFMYFAAEKMENDYLERLRKEHEKRQKR